jgi:Sap, sulfolipid-1-addressing protein
MGAAIGDVLGLAAGVAVSPLPIMAIILLLATPRGRANGSLFAVGWLAGLDRLRPGQALGLGALLSAVNPKNGGLTSPPRPRSPRPGWPAAGRRSPWPSSC